MQAWVAKNISDHIALWLVDIPGYKTGVMRIGHQCSDREWRKCMRQWQQHQLHSPEYSFKKWETCHRVPRCWPHSTVCRSLCQEIGRPGLMVTSHTPDQISRSDIPQCWPDIRDMGNFSEPLSRNKSHFLFGKRTWHLNIRWRMEA